MKAAARQKRIDLQCDINSNIEVYCDVKLIEQALINLLNNAIKYAPKDRQVMVGARGE